MLAVSVSSGLGRRLRRIRAAHAWVRRKSAVIALVLCITPVLVSYFHRNYDDQPMDIGVHVRRWDALDQWVFSGDGILD